MASAVSVVARRSPPWTPRRISPLSWGSTIGELPPITSPTFQGLTSTPITEWPRALKHAALTHPTYPSPKMLTGTLERFNTPSTSALLSSERRGPLWDDSNSSPVWDWEQGRVSAHYNHTARRTGNLRRGSRTSWNRGARHRWPKHPLLARARGPTYILTDSERTSQ